MKARYAIVIEQGEHNYAAYVPDVPGCVATGATPEEVQQVMQQALQAHIEVMQDDDPLAPPTTQVAYVEVDPSRKGCFQRETMFSE
jgi:predicted RNase H-like HicB family nuclease